MLNLFTVRRFALALLVLSAGGCADSCANPVSPTGVYCYQDADKPVNFHDGGNHVVVGGARAECTGNVTEIHNHVVLEYHTWIDWDELATEEESDYNVSDLITTVEWGCQNNENHDFKTVANGYTWSGGAKGSIQTGQSAAVTLDCNPYDRP